VTETGTLKDATIVLDLDGTLVDTAPDLTNALNDVLTRRSHAAVSAKAVRASVGLGARVMIEEALRVPHPLRGEHRERKPALPRRRGGA
jgi:phosphoglycolate phosphatase-like HAD superfamily hydrolase